MDPQIVQTLVNVVEMKDHSTAAHTYRVALYTQALAEAAGVDPVNVRRYMRAAALHDIGKIDIPYAVLTKPGRLTDEEFDLIKQHTILGYDRLKRLGETDEVVLSLVRSHHERLDGTGYPDGLVGDEVPTSARYFAVIDSFDAMTSLRSYRSEVGHDAAMQALDEIESKAGKWYCPVAVKMFRDLYESGKLDWILAYYNDEESMGSLMDIVQVPGVVTTVRQDEAPKKA